jgi:disulfide bond formation protein DsbB
MSATFLVMPRSGWLIFATSVAALVFALIMQYGFALEPCVLCLWQRGPFIVAALLALTACLKKPYARETQILLAACALVFVVGAALAFFHTGVERHWWLGTSGCAVQPLKGSAPEDLRWQLLHTDVARCDQIAWTFLGLTMANWNIPFSLSLAAFSLLAVRRMRT